MLWTVESVIIADIETNIMRITGQNYLFAERILNTAASSDLDFYRNIHDAARKLVVVDAFYLCIVQRSPDWLHFVYNCEGDRFDRPDPLPISNGPTSWVAKIGKPKIIVHPDDAVGLDYVQFADTNSHTWSAVHWPMWIHVGENELPDGVISVQAYPHGAYTEEDLAAIEWVSLRASYAIRRRSQLSINQVQLAKAEQLSAHNRLIADVRKFNSILDELSRDDEISAGILKKLRAIQIEIAHWAAGQRGASEDFESELANLSERELEVLVHVAQGRSSKEVGQILSLSEHTVKRHLDNVYRKTELKKRSDVIAAAIAINNIQMARMGH